MTTLSVVKQFETEREAVYLVTTRGTRYTVGLDQENITLRSAAAFGLDETFNREDFPECSPEVLAAYVVLALEAGDIDVE